MTIAAADPADHVEQLTVLTERLTTLILEQTRLFEARQPQAAAAATARSAELASLYRRESARIKASPELLASAPAAHRRRLVDATRSFEAALKRHGSALYGCKTVTEGLVRAVAEEVTRRRAPVAGYGPRARALPADGAAITLNRRA